VSQDPTTRVPATPPSTPVARPFDTSDPPFPAGWRRNLWAITAASFIGFAGFTLVMPFLPLYIAEMGVTDVAAVARWTGVIIGITPAMTALLAPTWGRMADRFGRKLMVGRSLLSFVIIMAAMAWATHPWHLLGLRAVQGLFAGYGALCLAMAADCAPKARLARSIAAVQTAQRLGPAVGPLIGGIVAGLVGLRRAFYVTAGFYAVALVQLLVLYHEPRAAAAAGGRRASRRVTFRNMLAFENFLLLMGVLFSLQFVERTLGPVLPLYIVELGTAPSDVPFVSGVAFSIVACAAALGNWACAALLRRWPARVVISRAVLVAAAGAGCLLVVGDAWTLMAAAAVFGIGVGTAMTATYTAAAQVMPEAARSTGFGFLTSASLTGIALSPAVSGFVGAADLRIVFGADAVLLCGTALAVRRVMAEKTGPAATPATEDT
jgi:MFS family permease